MRQILRKYRTILGIVFSSETLLGLRDRIFGRSGFFDDENKLKHRFTYKRVRTPPKWIINTDIHRQRLKEKPAIFGEPVVARRREKSVKASVISMVKGQDLWLTRNGRVFLDDGGALVECWHRQDNALKHHVKNVLHGIDLPEHSLDLAAVPVFDEVISVTQSNNYFYGHFLTEVVPRLLLAGQFCAADTPVYVTVQHDQYREILSLAGCGPGRIVSAEAHPLIRARRAVIPVFRLLGSYEYPQKFIELFNRIKERALGEAIARPVDGKKIYISRQHTSHSRILFEDALVDFLCDRGFECVCPETLSFRDQASLFHQADVVVGPHGSGMFNAVFCRRGARVIDLQPEAIIRVLYPIMLASGIDYRLVTSKVGHLKWSGKRRFAVPLDALDRALEA